MTISTHTKGNLSIIEHGNNGNLLYLKNSSGLDSMDLKQYKSASGKREGNKGHVMKERLVKYPLFTVHIILFLKFI